MRQTTLTLTAPIFYPELPGGFMQFYHYAPGLSERGVKMRVFTLTKDGAKPSCEIINSISIHREDAAHSNHVVEYQQLLQPALTMARANLSGSAQIIAPFTLNWTMARWLREAKKDGISSSLYVTSAPELPEDRWQALRVRVSTSMLLGALDRMVFCSSAQIDIHRRTCWIPKSKTLTIPNGVRTDRFRPASMDERHALREKLGLAQDEVIFIYAGNIIQRKGIDFLVRAWKAVQVGQPKARLLLLGRRTMPKTFRTTEDLQSYERFEGSLNDALSSLLPDALPVIFQPQTDRVEDWLRASDAFLFPSYCEGLPNALLEAMACGLPSITAPFSGFPKPGAELGTDGQEFILAPHDEKTWSQAIADLAENASKRAAIGTAATLWVSRYHDYSKILDLWAEHYHSTARLHTPKR